MFNLTFRLFPEPVLGGENDFSFLSVESTVIRLSHIYIFFWKEGQNIGTGEEVLDLK